jgi:hypothetical protein
MATSMIDCSVLRGHFLTRREAAIQAGMTGEKIQTLEGVIRIEGRYGSEEAYPALQFGNGGGFVPGLRDVVVQLAASLSGAALAGWVMAPQPALGGACVIDWLSAGKPHQAVEQLLHGTVAAAA